MMLIFIAICLLFPFLKQSDTIDDIDTSNVVVEFNPYVSIWDENNDKRYSVDQLVPIISKVASRFSKIYIDLDDDRFGESNRTSLLLSIFAAAKYNCQHNATNQIEVWLGITRAYCHCDSLDSLTRQAVNLADSANIECFGTVTTILLRQNRLYPGPYCKITPCPQNLTNRYIWAVLTTQTDYCDGNVNPYESFEPTFIVLEYTKEGQLTKKLTLCKSKRVKKTSSISIRKKLDLSDTGEDRVINMTGLVDIWKVWLSACNMCIFSQAFDSYSYKTRSWKTNGWWYLVRDTASIETERLIFAEKIKNARIIDYKESPQEFSWLKTSKVFNKRTTGIIYTEKFPFDTYSNDFCRVLIEDDHIPTATKLQNSTSKFLASCKGSSHLTILHYPTFPMQIISDKYIDYLLKADWDHITILFPIRYDPYRNDIIFNTTVIQVFTKLKIKYGYTFSLDTCTILNETETSNSSIWKNKFLEILADPNSTMYLFRFEEAEKSSRLGATRRFRHRSLMFEVCNEMVLNNRNSSTEVGYSMTRFHNEQNYYSSPVDMQNFVKFIDFMTEWVHQHENTMVFIGRDTGKDKDSASQPSAGWYIYDKENYEYVTSREKALRLSYIRYPEQNHVSKSSLSDDQIIMVALISLVFFAVVFVLSAYLLRLHYKENSLSDYDIEGFLNGEKHQENANECKANEVPYDKEKYEIPDNQFSIETSAPLGSGEFGTVNQGKIITSSGDISVAIKTTNPHKQHKTILNGLLSEIKVLAYVGKHENITELIGANISKLKDGKVYIFLELCHMGSLEKHLREISSLVKTSFTEDTGNVEMHYVNASSVARNMLDASLSEDLYRWSIEICNGMAYLAEKHVIHADLATRNVLLNLRREAKICDFGLSRRMYNYTNYVKTQQEPLPWKWMAPESLRYMQFNEKSDVWAYGITLWEIYSLGKTPYAGLSWDVNFVQMLEQGLTLSDPEFTDERSHAINGAINKCRKFLPEDRPKFSMILLQLKEKLDNK